MHIDTSKDNTRLPLVLVAPTALIGFSILVFFGFLGSFHFLLGLALLLLSSIVAVVKFGDVELRKFGILAVSLLFVNFVFYSTIEIFPLFDISLVVYILLGLILFCVSVRLKMMKSEKFKTPFLLPMSMYLISIGLSLIFAEHSKEVMYFFFVNFWAFVIGYSLYNLFLGEEGAVKFLGKALIYSGVSSAFFAIWQLYNDNFKILFFSYIADRDREIMLLWEVVSRVVGTWQHPSYLGIFLALCTPLLVYELFEQRKLYLRIWWSGGLIILFSVLLLTNTRSSVLAGFLGSSAVLIKFLFSNADRKRKLQNFAWLGTVAAVSLLFYQFVFVNQIYNKPQAYRVDASATIWGRFMRSDSMSTESLVQRSQLYELAWKSFSKNLAVGVGAKNFQYRVAEVFKKGTDAHNIFLQTLAEQGLVGILCLIYLLGTFFFAVGKRLISNPQSTLGFALAISMLLIVFDSFFNNPLYSLRLAGIFWTLFFLFCTIYDHTKSYAKADY